MSLPVKTDDKRASGAHARSRGAVGRRALNESGAAVANADHAVRAARQKRGAVNARAQLLTRRRAQQRVKSGRRVLVRALPRHALYIRLRNETEKLERKERNVAETSIQDETNSPLCRQ